MNKFTNKLLILAAFVLIGTDSIAQNKIGDNLGNHKASKDIDMSNRQLLNTSGIAIGSSAPISNASIALKIDGTGKAIVVSSVTVLGDITSPVNGMIVYNSTDKFLYVYRDNSWSPVSTTTVSLGNPNTLGDAKGATIGTDGSLSFSPATSTTPGIVTTVDQTFAGTKTFTGGIKVNGAISGTTTWNVPAAITTGSILNFPESGTLATLNGTETLANKTLSEADLGTPKAGVMTNVTGTAVGLTAGTAKNIAGGNAGSIPFQTAAGATAMLANGTDGQLLMSKGGANAPVWTTISATVPKQFETVATASQTTFDLGEKPNVNSKLAMYINGVRISNLAFSLSDKIVTYNSSNNGNYSLSNGDRIQIDYHF